MRNPSTPKEIELGQIQEKKKKSPSNVVKVEVLKPSCSSEKKKNRFYCATLLSDSKNKKIKRNPQFCITSKDTQFRSEYGFLLSCFVRLSASTATSTPPTCALPSHFADLNVRRRERRKSSK